MKPVLRFGATALALMLGLSAASYGAASQRPSSAARRAALDAEMGNDMAHNLRYGRLSAPQFELCISKSEGVTSYMRDCAALERERLDRLLNHAYRQKMATLPPRRRAALQLSERSWLKRRKAYCDSFVTPNGGTAQLLAWDGCQLNTTIHRTLLIRRFR